MAKHSDAEDWRDVAREGYRFGKWYFVQYAIGTAIFAVIVAIVLWVWG